MSWFDDFKAWLSYTRQHNNPSQGEFRIHQFAPDRFVVQLHNGEAWKGLTEEGKISGYRFIKHYETLAQAVEALALQRARWSSLFEGEIERLLGSEVSYYPEGLHPVRKHRGRSWKVEKRALEVALKGFE
ncbi:hypothetical protein HOU02_gp243 [Caulobacter phage CcrBL9]|uniref:Uncharacterized protein n=1 Tax=Caulobacter phage CcrBL9 TaxID=2283270 RepID=A0A385EF64_9CAUD|nr:hypothetical protein HOU02_gp243 [Caulobacter phage CcrBL9]AXQ69482.1 hypothetical protein CcrBL9_gp458 [Caulobacter phage CcrBL9]